MIYKLIIINCIVLLLCACENLKPRAQGADNEVIVIASFGDRKDLKLVLSKIFNDTLYTPQPEPYFKIVWVEPKNFNQVNDHVNVIVGAIGTNVKNTGVKLVKNLLSTDQYESAIQDNNQLIFSNDVFARNQNYLIINGVEKKELMKLVLDQGPWLKKQYDKLFIKRQSKHLFESSTLQKELEISLSDRYGWSMKIPWGYTVIKDSLESQFFWIGREMPYRWLAVKREKGLFFSDSSSVKNYIDSFPEKYFGNIKYSESFLKIEPSTFNNWGAWKISGLWENLEEAQGGPFVSYFFYDEKSNQSFFIHTMIFHPGKDKYMLLRQLDIIAHSFRITA